MYYFNDGLLLLVIILVSLVSTLTFALLFASIEFAIRGSAWRTSFIRTFITCIGFQLFAFIILFIFDDFGLYW